MYKVYPVKPGLQHSSGNQVKSNKDLNIFY